MKYFGNFDLSIEVQQSIKNMNIVEPTPIQERTIPAILDGKDVVGIGQTGTGKTLAYGATMISMLQKDGELKGLILAPTRELTLQIEQELKRLTVCAPMRVVSAYGGSQIEKQINDLKRGTDILVATPGRLLDLMKRKVVSFEKIQMVVIDEADEMLKMGFIEDVDLILSRMPDKKQMLLFSATMKAPIKKLLNTYMRDYVFIQIDERITTASTVKQYYLEVRNKDKLEALARLIDYYSITRGLIFCLTKKGVDDLAYALRQKGYRVEAIHGDLTQEQRFKALNRFKNGEAHLLVATDVMARGIDIKDISHVINYEVGKDKDSYVHRIGRTGRASQSGVALSLVTYKEKYYLEEISKALGCYIQKMYVPANEQIIQAKSKEILEEASHVYERKGHVDFLETMQAYDYKTLALLSASMMKMLYDDRIGFNDKVLISNDSEIKKVRVNAGSVEKMSYTALKKAIMQNTNIPEDRIRNIQIERKYSIIEVHQDYVDELINKLNRVKVSRTHLKLEKMGD